MRSQKITSIKSKYYKNKVITLQMYSGNMTFFSKYYNFILEQVNFCNILKFL